MHFGAVILLFGQFVFLFVVAGPGKPPPHFARSASWSLAVALAAALGWLAPEAQAMSGLPLERALHGETLGVVLTQTLFGRLWLVRLILIVTLGATIAAARGMIEIRHRTRAQVFGASLAAVLLVTLAGMGHAAAERGLERVFHLCADVLHLLAAGAWLGSLFPLILLLGRCARTANAEELDFAARAARRFSRLGVVSMSALLLSGILNAFYTLSSFAMLLQTQYGWLLLAKVSLFGLILCFAATNRITLISPLSRQSGIAGRVRAAQKLRRNAIAEFALGLAIIAIVGKLGITMPAVRAYN